MNTPLVRILQKVIAIAIIMLLIDGVYLTLAKGHFAKVVRSIQKTEMNVDIWGAILSYTALIVGFYWFIASRNASLLDAMMLGWVIYFVFDGTNRAMFKNYGWDTVLLDGIWGGLLFGLVWMTMKMLKL
jgi:uncharacterized membrane protein